MAIDLQNSQNIASGWGRPPDFSAPNISGVLGDILRQRQFQQELQQKQIADAVKAIQEQRQQNAYASALRDTGLSEGQDLSGVSSADQTRIAQLLQARTPDTDRDALVRAQTARLGAATNRENTVADAIRNRGGVGGGDAGEPEIVVKDGIKYEVVRTSKSVTYHRLPGQYGPSRTEQENAAPTTTGFTVYPDNTAAPLSPDAAPQPSPAETGDTIQTSKVQPTTGGAGNVIIDNTTGLPLHPPGGGADKNLAPGYGVQGVKMQAPDGTVKTVSPDQVDYYKTKGAVVVP